MTVALASHVDALDLPAASGVSHRAIRAVLRTMARIADDAGSFRWGIRVVKIGERTDYSPATVKRAQAFLVAHGLIERVRVGGGRSSTHWRVVVDKLRPRATSTPPASEQPARREPGQGHQTGVVRGWVRRNLPVTTPGPPRWRAGARVETCEHGGQVGLLPSGVPRCPQCRRRR